MRYEILTFYDSHEIICKAQQFNNKIILITNTDPSLHPPHC